MLKTNKSKQNVTILVLSVMLAIAAIFGVTAAWFISSDNASGKVGTGAVKVELMYNNAAITNKEAAFTVDDAVAGDNILAGNIAVKVTAKGTGVYLKATIVVEGTTELSADDFTITKADGWVYDEVGKCYYYGTSATVLTEVVEADVSKAEGKTIPLATGIELATTSNAQNVTGVTVKIHVDAVQSANQGKDGAAIVWGN